jgi:hypothetical protein
MSQSSEFDAQVRSELLALRAGSLGWCAACGGPVLVEENFMRLEGRVAHVSCPPGAPTGGDLDRVRRWAPARSGARSPRAQIALICTLRRRSGSPIPAETIEVGPEGMRVTAQRPLATDETVNFELPNLRMRVAGLARVLRQQRPHVYAMRFEGLPEPMYRCLHALARAPHSQLARRPGAGDGAGRSTVEQGPW